MVDVSVRYLKFSHLLVFHVVMGLSGSEECTRQGTAVDDELRFIPVYLQGNLPGKTRFNTCIQDSIDRRVMHSPAKCCSDCPDTWCASSSETRVSGVIRVVLHAR